MIIARYLLRLVLGSSLLVLLLLAGIGWLLALVDELPARTDRYGLAEVLLYTLLRAGRQMLEMIPAAGLIGALWALSGLAAGSELTVLRASGVAPLRMAAFVAVPALLIAAVGVLLGETLGPWGEARAEALKDRLADSRSAAWFWLRTDDRWVRIGSVDLLDGTPRDVRLWRYDAARGLLEQARAPAAGRGDGGGGGAQVWVLAQGQALRPGASALEPMEQPPRFVADGDLRAAERRALLEPRSMAITDLWGMRGAGGAGGSPTWSLALWQKLSLPPTVLALVLLGTSFLFGPLRSSGTGVRLAAGVLVAVTFRFAQDLLGPASLVFGFSPVLATLGPALLVGAVAGVLLRRAG